MIKRTFYSLKNLFMYRSPREPDERFANIFTEFAWNRDREADVQRSISDMMLYGAGLRTVHSENEVIPSLVYLTPLQKNLRKMVEENGFMVGLL